ncbi:MAG: efflux RND transporter permease subunit [Sandaracinaceae bacterium]|nr:efflux RND transporter permease subunit [Sandaracinaceae bacterium]
MTLSDVSIKRPVFTIMVSLAIVVLGIMGLLRLGVNLFPDVEFPIVTVTTVYPGASPAELESQVSQHIEDAIVSVPGVKHMTSFSRESVSFILIEFDLSADAAESAALVRERVAGARRLLPREAEEPTVARFDVNATPIATYVLAGEISETHLRDFAEDTLKPALETLEGVASIEIVGGRERQVNVLLDLDRIQALGLTPLSVVERIRSENLSVPGGNFDEGTRRINVRTLGEFESVAELRDLPITTGADGSIVRLGDLADVEDAFADLSEVVRANGEAAIIFNVFKTSGGNTVEVSATVREHLAAMTLPSGMETRLIIDQSEYVLENIHEVQISLWFGGAMAILVILLFLLDLRSTFISALALPTSVLGSFFLMWLLDFTLNMMSLLGLSLAIGLLIDDSIVVRENIMKHLERGADPKTAASQGTKEITLAVLATTATLCAVFVPVAFTGGVVGQFFREFGLTIAGATVISAYVAFTLDPMLSAYLAKTKKHGEQRESSIWDFIVKPLTRFYDTLDSLYHAFLAWVLKSRVSMGVALLFAFGVAFSSCALVPLMGSEFTAPEDRGQFNIDIELPAGTRLEEASRLSLPAERELVADPNMVTLYSRVGSGGRSNLITWRVVAVPKNEREATQNDLKAQVRALILRHIPGAEISISDPGIVEGGRDYPIQIAVMGDDLEQVAVTANHFADVLRRTPGAIDVDVQHSPGAPELDVRVDRDLASQLHIPLALVASTVRASIEGEVAGLYHDDDDDIDIRVRLREADRANARQVGGLRIPTTGGFIPLTDIATVERGEGPAEIQRFDRRRVVMVTGSSAGRAVGDVVTEFEAVIGAETLPVGVDYLMRGQVEQMNESNENMMLAMLLGLVFVYLVLASQFESFIHPISIMMSIPMAFVGAFIALFLQGSSMSMGATIGLILLMGLVTKNGILLVDHAVTKVRDEGWTPHEAILHAGPARMRPILMTSAAMVLGMLPTAVGDGPGSEFRGPMAMGVIGGVISSTLLTLIVVPIFYLLLEWVSRSARHLWVRWILGKSLEERRLVHRKSSAEAEPVETVGSAAEE